MMLKFQRAGNTDSSTPVDIVLPAIAPEQCARVRFVALENTSGESVTLQLGIIQLGSFHQIYAKQTVANNDAFGALVDIHLGEGDTFSARVTGASDSGPVQLFVHGAFANLQPEVEAIEEAAAAGQ